jgi:hypothetical protein
VTQPKGDGGANSTPPALGEWDGPVYGELGVLATDGTRLECHACGRWYASLAGHALPAHGLSAAAYRAVFGLKAQTPLAGPRLRARRRELADTRLAPYRARVAEVARAQTSAQRAARMRGRALRLEARLALAADPEHARRLSAGARRAWEQRRERYPETAGAGRPEAVRPFADARAASRRGLAVRRERLRDPAYRAAVGRRISEGKGGRVEVTCAVCGRAFRVPPSWIVHQQARICGPACRERWRLGRRKAPGGLSYAEAAARLRALESADPRALDRALPPAEAAAVRLAYGLGADAPLALRAAAARTNLPFRRVGSLVAGPVVGGLIGAPAAPPLAPTDQTPAPKRSARTAPARIAGT